MPKAKASGSKSEHMAVNKDEKQSLFTNSRLRQAFYEIASGGINLGADLKQGLPVGSKTPLGLREQFNGQPQRSKHCLQGWSVCWWSLILFVASL